MKKTCLRLGMMMFWEKDNAIESIEMLAAMHRRKGNLAQAKSLYACLIAMIKRRGGAKCDELALNFYQLGEIYDDESKHDAARTYYKRAADVWQSNHEGSDNNPFWYREALTRLGEESEKQQEQHEHDSDRRRRA
jgi:tetratricopeptide (TPR) repeat protein